MYNQTLYNGLVNIVPFWSSNLIQLLGLGNEYNIAFNMIITELLKITTCTLNDNILLLITSSIIIVYIGYKFGFSPNINLWTKNVIILKAKEIYNVNGFSIEYSNKILSLNNYLLNVKNIKNITYIDDINIIINSIINYKLTTKIFLNINRTKNDNGICYVTYELVSYTQDIDKFITYIVNEYKKDSDSQIMLIGDETNKMISYPEPIHAINYYVNKNFNFPKLKCMKLINNLSTQTNNGTTTNTHDTEQTKTLKTISNVSNDYSYTLDNIVNFNLGKIYLTINRENQQVYYFIKSTQANCKEWLDKIINEYSQNKYSKFANKIVLTGKEEIVLTMTSFRNYYYSREMWALNWLLIEKLDYQHFQCVNGDNQNKIYKYVLEPLELYKIDDDLFLTIEKDKFDNLRCGKSESKYINSFDVIYTLYSNSLNLKNIIEKYTKEFDLYKNNISSNKILYHFTYAGMKNNELIFNSRILSETNTDRELFETFDTIYNEHTLTFKRDIDKLKDFEYYKSHGLKRKKGYLFHGIPGCGKTSCVVAMALYDSRHIIEIPFSLITTHQEFEKIMNLKLINNIEINNNNIILLFDEIDIGMEKIGSRNNNNKIKTSDVESVVKAIINSDNNIDNIDNKNTTEQKINLGTLLSKLDGIGNYNGLIIVGTTNYIDKLDPALYRELRLTPVEFKQLRKSDCISIIQSYFGSNYDPELNNILKDRYFTPTTLISLCQKYDNENVEYFFNNVLKDIIGE